MSVQRRAVNRPLGGRSGMGRMKRMSARGVHEVQWLTRLLPPQW